MFSKTLALLFGLLVLGVQASHDQMSRKRMRTGNTDDEILVHGLEGLQCCADI